MTLRTAAALALAGATVLAAPQAHASRLPIAPFAVTLDIAYEPPPDPDFTGGLLVGHIQFYFTDPNVAGVGFTPDGAPVDIGQLRAGQTFETRLFPPDPCFADGSCRLFFSFGGSAAGFQADAFGAGAIPPGPPDTAPLLPAVQDGLLPAVQKRLLPAVQTGPICAFDAPVQVGDWTATLSAAGAPEPGAWSLLIAGFAGVGAMLRRARRPLTI